MTVSVLWQLLTVRAARTLQLLMRVNVEWQHHHHGPVQYVPPIMNQCVVRMVILTATIVSWWPQTVTTSVISLQRTTMVNVERRPSVLVFVLEFMIQVIYFGFSKIKRLIVCGTDGVTYNNECELEQAACKSVLKIAISVRHSGRCSIWGGFGDFFNALGWVGIKVKEHHLYIAFLCLAN